MKIFFLNLKTDKQSGITLIALVISIIVLLILAGVSIGILAGDNGILKKSQSANTATIYYSAYEQVRLAYITVNAEIITQKNLDVNYNACTAENISKLGKIVENQLGGSEWNVSYNDD